MAKKDVVRLLVRLFGDPALLERLTKDPAKALKSTKLSAKERELLASADSEAIRDYLGRDKVKAVIKSKTELPVIKSKFKAVIKSKFTAAVIKSKFTAAVIKSKTKK